MGVRQVRRDSRASSNHRGYWCSGTVQREKTGEDRGVSRGERKGSGSKDQVEMGEDRQRRGEGGGGKTRVHP